MTKRILAGVLWFYVTWYAWNVVAVFAGLTLLAGPLFGLLVAWLVVRDPRGAIWRRRKRATTDAADLSSEDAFAAT